MFVQEKTLFKLTNIDNDKKLWIYRKDRYPLSSSHKIPHYDEDVHNLPPSFKMDIKIIINNQNAV
jgi:hypothetical protein